MCAQGGREDTQGGADHVRMDWQDQRLRGDVAAEKGSELAHQDGRGDLSFGQQEADGAGSAPKLSEEHGRGGEGHGLDAAFHHLAEGAQRQEAHARRASSAEGKRRGPVPEGEESGRYARGAEGCLETRQDEGGGTPHPHGGAAQGRDRGVVGRRRQRRHAERRQRRGQHGQCRERGRSCREGWRGSRKRRGSSRRRSHELQRGGAGRSCGHGRGCTRRRA